MIRFRAPLAASIAIGLYATCLPAHPRHEDEARDSTYLVLSRDSFDASNVLARDASVWTDRLGRDLVIAEVGAQQAADVNRHIHEVEQRCGGFFAFDSRAEAEAFIAADRTADAIAWPMGGLYTIDNHGTVDAWLPQALETNIRGTIASLSSFKNRYYKSSYGLQAAEWIRDAWLSLATGRSDVSVELFTQCTNCSTQPSVILTVQGTELPNEVVVIGGHLDSISGNSLEQIAPGADDDASGIATITEIIRVALASGWQPKRTVKFMGYAAEEVGLLGSKSIATRFKNDGVNVVGVLQLDMTNYKAGTPYDLQIISDNSNAALKTYFGQLFDEYLAPLGLTRTDLACGYGCSDHASWTSQGFPAAMVFEAGEPRTSGGLGDFPYIHTPNDTLANLGDSAVNSVKFAKFGLAFLGEMAKTHVGGAVNQPPAAAFTYVADRMTVHFTDTSTDADGSIASRHWDFDDGSSSSLPNPDKTFDVVGAHTVALTVVDDGGLPNATIQSIAIDNGTRPLLNGAPASGLAAQTDTFQDFAIDLPSGARNLRFTLAGAAGENADLSITFGGQAACSSAQPGADETCAIANPPAPGAYTATVHARTALTGFAITASFVPPGDGIFDDGFDP